MEQRFLVTDESGRLARWLRLLGHDTALMSAQPLSGLYRRAFDERRIIVTRNRRVRPSALFQVIQLESQALTEQLRQMLRTLKLEIDPEQAFSRCDCCNVPVQPIDKMSVKDRVPPYVFETQQAFHICPACQRIYWAATHWQRAQQFFAELA